MHLIGVIHSETEKGKGVLIKSNWPLIAINNTQKISPQKRACPLLLV